MTQRLSTESKRLKIFQSLLIVTSIAIFLLIVVGGIVRVTGSGGACLEWPLCQGDWSLSESPFVNLDFIHRLTIILVMPLILTSAYIAFRYFRKESFITISILLALIFFIAQIILGVLYFRNLSQITAAMITGIHFGFSLLILVGFITASVYLFSRQSAASKSNLSVTSFSLSREDKKFSILVMITLAVYFLLMVSGAITSSAEFENICSGWPLCAELIESGNVIGWISIIHRFITLVSGLLIGIIFLYAWKNYKNRTIVLVSISAVATLYFAQSLMGAKLVNGYEFFQLSLHQATSVAGLSVLIILVTRIRTFRYQKDGYRINRIVESTPGMILKDLLMLTKPIVVLLLLITTFAGMVIGGRAWPDFSVTMWTMLAGFLAAGGSGAINQYIDRYDDNKMQRTQKRPIPSGRLTPGQGLAFGVILVLMSFYIMVAFVNNIAALLSLAGIIYYVLIYSILLKKTTVQNIVIGGGAGAIPPLVGWAAATGSLNIPSLFLFALVFMWTPPHFWALALVRKKDYARAGVPMLPVVKGEKETRWQIFLYTIELVILTLVLPLFGLGGAVYIIGAVILGAWLIMAAWKVWKGTGNKVAWKMYRYSSMYLAFIFLVLMIDRLL